MLRVFIVLSSLCFFFAGSQVAWSSKGQVQDYKKFFVKAIQEMIYDVEKRGFSVLKMTDYVIKFDQTLYNWRVIGNATYTDGFVISIQKIDVTNITPKLFKTTTTNNETLVTASVEGLLNLRDVMVGFNVDVNTENDGVHRFTGTFNHVLVEIRLWITKDLITNEITSDSYLSSLSSVSGVRMIYMPASNITEVLSRTYIPGNNWDGAVNWGKHVFEPTLVKVVNERVPFPEVCFSDC